MEFRQELKPLDFPEEKMAPFKSLKKYMDLGTWVLQ